MNNGIRDRMFVDSHAHLTAKEFDADRDAVIRRAADAGVRWIINPSTTVEDSRRAIALAESHPRASRLRRHPSP